MTTYMTTEEVADLVRAPVATVHHWRYTGTGPRGIKVGRRVLYTRDDVTAWLDAKAGEISVR